MSSRSLLIVMAKEPRPGFVKTRLSPPFPAEDATRLYEAMLRDVLDQANRELNEVLLSVAFVPLTARPYFLSVLPDRFDCFPQRGPDLSQRMANVFGDAFNLGHEKIVMRNSDSPHMPEDSLRAAFEALDDSDLVLAPDGREGYSLVGLKRPCPQIFTEVTMSTASVFEETVALAKRLDLKTRLLDPILDLDTAEDVERFRELLPKLSDADRHRMPQTLSILKALGWIEI